MEKQLALITGASGSIGSGIAKILAKHSIDVILHYHQNNESVNEVEKEILSIEKNTQIHKVQADLSNKTDIDKMFTYLNGKGLKPTILVNAAGAAYYGLIQDVSFDDFQKLINLNLMSTFFVTQHVIANMVKNKYGRIINISSIWGENGAANEVLYSTTKGAINTFTKSLAKELAPSSITVNAIAPGFVMSNMNSSFNQEEIEMIKVEIPMGRFASPDEVAQSVLHFIHPKSSYLTGQILTIDGGWTL